MRRLAVLGATIVATTTIAVGGLSGAASAGTPHIKPHSKWTLEVYTGFGNSCLVETIGKGHTFTDDKGDAGIYVGGGKTVTESWTSGSGTGASFDGTWVSAETLYNGTFLGFDAELVKGAISGC